MNLETFLSWAERTAGLATPEGATRLAAVLHKSVAETQSWWQETFG